MIDENEEDLGGPHLRRESEESSSSDDSSRGEMVDREAQDAKTGESSPPAAASASAPTEPFACAAQQAASSVAHGLQQGNGAHTPQQAVYLHSPGYAAPHPGGSPAGVVFPAVMNVTRKESTVERISQQEEFDWMRDPRDFRHLTAHHPLYDAQV